MVKLVGQNESITKGVTRSNISRAIAGNELHSVTTGHGGSCAGGAPLLPTWVLQESWVQVPI